MLQSINKSYLQKVFRVKKLLFMTPPGLPAYHTATTACSHWPLYLHPKHITVCFPKQQGWSPVSLIPLSGFSLGIIFTVLGWLVDVPSHLAQMPSLGTLPLISSVLLTGLLNHDRINVLASGPRPLLVSSCSHGTALYLLVVFPQIWRQYQCMGQMQVRIKNDLVLRMDNSLS